MHDPQPHTTTLWRQLRRALLLLRVVALLQLLEHQLLSHQRLVLTPNGAPKRSILWSRNSRPQRTKATPLRTALKPLFGRVSPIALLIPQSHLELAKRS